MKKCPICDRTFADGLNFCQTDGTPLIEVSDAVKGDSFKPVSAFSSKDDETDFLELSEEAGFSPTASSLPADNINELTDDWRQEKTNLDWREEKINPPPSAAFDELKPVGDQDQFDQSNQTPSPLRMAEIKAEALNTPYAEQVEQQPPPFEQTNWTSPPVPEANWQNQQINQNAPFHPMPVGQAQDQTLPIISLVLGILSLCCYISPLTGIAALVTGFLGIKNINDDPIHFGGKTLAIIGMILGGLFGGIGLIYYIFKIIF